MLMHNGSYVKLELTLFRKRRMRRHLLGDCGSDFHGGRESRELGFAKFGIHQDQGEVRKEIREAHENAVKEHHKISPEILRISDIMSV